MPDYPKLVAAFDPGQSGGLALIGDGFIEAHAMPETRADFVDLLEQYMPHIVRAVVEKVHSSPQMGVTSAFTFGMNYERILMALTCLKIPLVEVTPGVWQKAFMLKKGKGLGMSPTEKKRDHRRVAQELFPSIRVTLAICDSLLIGEWGRRQA